MIRRVRDVKKGFGPLKLKGTISYDQWQEVEQRADLAERFLREDNPFSEILKKDLENARETIIENRVRKVEEVRFNAAQIQNQGKSISFIPEQVRRILTTPRRVQIDELTGQYKYIKAFLAQIQGCIDIKKQYEKDEADGLLIIERNKEKHG